MLNLKFIQENPELVIERLAVKCFDARAIVEKVIALYKRRNEAQNEAETEKAEMNRLSKEIGQLFKDGKATEADVAKERTRFCANKMAELPQRYLLSSSPQVYSRKLNSPQGFFTGCQGSLKT